MKMLTRNGVAKDLSNTPYQFTEIIDGKVVTFNFSNKLHLNNFEEKREQNFAMIYNYIYKRFKFKINCRLLADCNLYKKIETRGFNIKINNKEFLCPNSIILNGESKMNENLLKWQETSIVS